MAAAARPLTSSSPPRHHPLMLMTRTHDCPSAGDGGQRRGAGAVPTAGAIRSTRPGGRSARCAGRPSRAPSSTWASAAAHRRVLVPAPRNNRRRAMAVVPAVERVRAETTTALAMAEAAAGYHRPTRDEKRAKVVRVLMILTTSSSRRKQHLQHIHRHRRSRRREILQGPVPRMSSGAVASVLRREAGPARCARL